MWQLAATVGDHYLASGLPWCRCVIIDNFFLYMVDTEKHILLFYSFSDICKGSLYFKKSASSAKVMDAWC
jgi:hypothetical protein